MAYIKSEFEKLIGEMIYNSDFIDNPAKIYDLLNLLGQSENNTISACKIFLLKHSKYLSDEFLLEFLSRVDKHELSKDKDILKLFEDNEEILLFLKL
jgi:hypothetical protein